MADLTSQSELTMNLTITRVQAARILEMLGKGDHEKYPLDALTKIVLTINASEVKDTARDLARTRESVTNASAKLKNF